MDKRIFHLKGRLSQNLGRTWTVGEMAAVAQTSVPHFHRIFRTENDGNTPKAYLHDLRLEVASEMLADPDCLLQIGEIGIAVGLMNESHFTQDFKVKYGMTPTQFQKHQAENYQFRLLDETKGKK